MTRTCLASPVGFLIALSFGLGACSGSSASSPADAPGGPSASVDGTQPSDGGGVTDGGGGPGVDGSSAVGTAGCSKAAGATGIQEKTLTVAGKSRRYQLFVPAGYDAKSPTRLVFVFHGLGGDGDQIRSYLNLEPKAAGRALIVYPDGLEQAEQGGRTAWSLGDVAFFDAMVAEISASRCVDRARVFAAGHSFGAYMSNLVGCERGDVVRAIAPVSGGIVSGACKGPVAAWLAHGKSDPVVADSEGIAARDHWIEANGCAKTSKPASPSSCVTYDGCKAGSPVTWCSWSGGHYPLPSYTTQAIWDFFAAL